MGFAAALSTNNWTAKLDAFEIAALVPARWIVMIRRAILAFATLIALNQTATAGVLLFGHVSCAVVRFYVAKYSEVAAEKWARTHGASDAEIETARRCLHSANVQTASLAVKSQTPVTEQERAQHEPAKPDPGQDAAHVTPVLSVQDQRADSKQDDHENKSGVHGVIPPKDSSVGHVSYESKDLSRSDGKASTLRSRYVHAVRRERSRVTGVSWLKRLWDHLTRGRQFRVAVLHFGGGRR
ncbi:MAG TPA: hypothetical protein VFU86_07885 [Terriglobales bacterium]|nr:hypothetical protein [Terriglobales bacterium]